MNRVRGRLKSVIEHLEAKGVLTASDTKAIFHALEQLQVNSTPPAPKTEKPLSGPYWEARHKALHDPKFHP
jgi:hypothetical protein